MEPNGHHTSGEEKSREQGRTTKKERVLLEHHLPKKIAETIVERSRKKESRGDGSRGLEGCRAHPAAEAERVWSVHGGRYPIRSLAQASLLAAASFFFSSFFPPQTEAGPGRDRRRSSRRIWNRERRQAGRLPSTKEAASMPPCRALVAGRLRQST